MFTRDTNQGMRPAWAILVAALVVAAPGLGADARVRITSELWVGSPGDTLDFLDLSEDGRTLLAAASAGVIQIWQRDGSRWVRHASLETCPLCAATWLPGPEIVLARCEDGSIAGMDIDGVERYALPVPGGALAGDPVASLAASADGWHVATVGQSGTLAFWDGEDGSLRAIDDGAYCPDVSPFVSPDGGVVVLPPRSDDNPYCGYLDARHAGGDSLGPLPLASRPAFFDATGRILITRYDPNRGIRSTVAWDARDGRLLFFGRIEPNVLAAFVMAASPDPEDPAPTSSMLWSTTSQLTRREEDLHCVSRRGARPGGLPVLVYKGERGLEFCDPLDGSITYLRLGNEDTPMDMTLDGRFVAVGTENGHAVVVELQGADWGDVSD